MSSEKELATVSEVHENRSYLFTATDPHDTEEEIIVVPCNDSTTDITEPVRAYVNRCTHEPQRLDTGRGVAFRENQIICPRHGSTFDACSGYCDSGEAEDTTLPGVEVTVMDGTVFLTDEDYTFQHEGGIDQDDGGPSSTSHVGF